MDACRLCGTTLTDDNWYPSLKKKNSKICKKCNTKIGNEWKTQNPIKTQEYSKRYYERHPKYNIPWGRQNRLDIREEMIKAYGGKCAHCGIDNPIVLDIDHIDNNGGEHRKQGMWGWKLYRWLRKNNYPKDNYQLLCRNCNWIKEMERRRGSLPNIQGHS